MSAVVPAIVIAPSKQGEGAYYEAKGRDRDGRQVKRRVGQAWVARDANGEWRRRRGRTPAGWLDARMHVAAAALVERVERERAEEGRPQSKPRRSRSAASHTIG